MLKCMYTYNRAQHEIRKTVLHIYDTTQQINSLYLMMNEGVWEYEYSTITIGSDYSLAHITPEQTSTSHLMASRFEYRDITLSHAYVTI